ncbi:MAG: Ig-like domain-containing protein, partial [Clostridia bacterium]|nr:Ig-like domain-containing protein [Clostridia bacterium]
PQQGELVPLLSEIKLGVKEKFDIDDIISIPEGTHASYTYKIKSTSYASVGGDGVITAKKKGNTTITVTAHSGASFTIPVKVFYAPKAVSANPANLTLGVEQTFQLQPRFASGYYADCTYESEFPDIVAVNTETGMLEALKEGTCRIKIRTSNGKTAMCNVTVLPAPSEITLQSHDITLGVGEPNGRVVGVNLTEGSCCDFRYVSSDPEKVAVNATNGALTAIAEGSATITVTSSNGLTDTATVTVVPSPTSIVATCDRIRIGIREVVNAADFVKVNDGSHASYLFTSKSSSIAKVDAAGNITGVKAGSTSIGIKTYNNHTVYIPITVYRAPSRVTISPKALTMAVGMEGKATAAITANTVSRLTYTSSNTDAVIVDPATGEFKAVGAGEATITVKTYNNLTDKLNITVMRAPEADEIWTDPAEFILGAGETTSSVKGVYAEGTLTTFSYTSSDPEKVAVDPVSGKLEAKLPGEAIITATSHNGKTAQCKVTVLNAPEHLTLSHSALTIMVGESNTDIKAHCEEGAACGTLTYASLDTAVVQVRDNALYGVKPGTATIVATTYNGVSEECVVTVKPAPTGIEFAVDSFMLGAGETANSTVSITPGSYSKLRCSISDSSILSYDMATGEIKALKSGDATITVTTYNDISAVCNVSVFEEPKVIILPETMLLSAGMSAKLEAGFAPNAYGCLKYTVTEGDCIEVSEDGTVKALSEGTATVTVSTYNDVSNKCIVTVKAAPDSVSYGELEGITIAKGDTVKVPVPAAMY